MTMRCPIRAIATARSFDLQDVDALAAAAGLSPADRQALRDNGLRRVPVATLGIVELLAEVLHELRTTGWDPRSCGFCVFCHSLELADEQLEQLDDMLQRELPSLERAPLLITGRPCSILHLGIDLGVRHSRRGSAATTLVLGADVAPTLGDRFFFGSTMGDSAAGMVLGDVPICGEILAVVTTHRILAADGAQSPGAEIERFRAQNPTAIRATIEAALAAAELSWSDLTAIVPHTPYRRIWDSVAEVCRFPRQRILDQGLGQTGHLNSNDVLVHLVSAGNDGSLRAGDVVALVSPGFGGSRGCTLVRWNACQDRAVADNRAALEGPG